MKFTRNGSVQLIAGVIAGASVIVAACGGDDSTDTSSTTGADAGGSTSSTSSSGSTSSTSSSGSTTSSSSSGGTDAGGDAAKEAGGGDGGTGTVANGGACTADIQCKSGHCFQQNYCTVTCTNKQATDPVCQALGGNFTGKCNKQGFCQMQ